jgi:hypothetical protein
MAGDMAAARIKAAIDVGRIKTPLRGDGVQRPPCTLLLKLRNACVRHVKFPHQIRPQCPSQLSSPGHVPASTPPYGHGRHCTSTRADPGNRAARASSPKRGTITSRSPAQSKGPCRCQAGTPSIWNCFLRLRAGLSTASWNCSLPCRGLRSHWANKARGTPPASQPDTTSSPPHKGTGTWPGAVIDKGKARGGSASWPTDQPPARCAA